MKFAEELKEIREDSLADYAIEFAENIKPKLIESAESGYNGFEINLKNREDAHMLRNSEFQENLELLFEGCKVRIDSKEFTNIIFKNKYHEYYLVISWA